MVALIGASLIVFNGLLCVLAIPEGKRYEMEIKTSNWLFAGTDSSICFRLAGYKDGQGKKSPWKCVSGKGGAYERGSIDHEELLSPQDFDGLSGVEVRVRKAQGSGVIDHWKLAWIRIQYNQTTYRAFFYTTFKKHMQIKSSYEMTLEDCPAGFHAINDGKVDLCIDRNECEEYCNKPAQICENIPGGYICKCKEGFEPIGDSCEDINECYHPNYTDCYGQKNAHCVNTMPGYTCECNEGYAGFPCQDVNECASIDHNDCEQICKNTKGSYKCQCRRGFLLAANGRSCIEARKCKYNPCNETTSRCFDINGNYECQCKEGYVKRNATVDQECSPRKCFPLTITDSQVTVSPNSCLTPGAKHYRDTCKFSCQIGYALHENSADTMVCDANGIWTSSSGTKSATPNCIPTLCPKLQTIEDGYLVPYSCTKTGIQHGGSCTFYCNNGYKLVGNHTVKCNNKEYVDYAKPHCVQIPKIECPEDVAISLPINKNKVSLGPAYIGVISNMDDKDIRSNPPYVSADYEFPLGHTTVKMFAKNEVGDEASCTYRVHVKDTSPPVVKCCPQDMLYTTKGTGKVFVKWKEPEFVDNIGIKKIRQTQKNNEYYPPTSFNVLYDAVDVNGNLATCEFTVVIKVITCSFDCIEGGDQTILKYCTSMSPVSAFCTAQCPDGKVFHQSPPFGMKNAWMCFDGNFQGVERIPDCVDKIPLLQGDKKCPRGSVMTYDYRDQTGTPKCGKCPRGTQHVTDKCVSCPKHTYQDEEGQVACKNCPMGFGTKKTRNVNQDTCIGMCPAGFHSPTGFVDFRNGGCIACEKESYSFGYGSTACTPCPEGTSAQDKGAISRTECLAIPKSLAAVPSTYVTVLAGNNVTFSCVSYTQPPQKLEWNIKPLVFPGSSRFTNQINDSPSQRVLSYTITDARPEDSRKFTCEATDVFGARSSIVINVRVVPLRMQ